MSLLKKLIYLLFITPLMLIGCESRQPESTTSIQTDNPAAETASVQDAAPEVHLFELPSEALHGWQNLQGQKPTLILFSNDPFLQPIPAELQDEALNLIQQGSAEDIKAKLFPYTEDPLLLPQHALSAALSAQIFRRIIWILPSKTPKKQLSLEIFRQQLIELGAATKTEVQSFSRKGNTFSGEIKGTPFTAATPLAFPETEGPVVVHIDLSYFKSLYTNEIKTPLFPIIYSTLTSVRNSKWNVSATTISQSNLTGLIALQTRFLGPVIATLTRNPDLLEASLPPNLIRLRDIFYMENLFQPDKILTTALAMQRYAPKDPSVYYALYQAYRRDKKGYEALAALDQAVALDRGYAIEYLSLAPMALKKQQPDEAVRMLRQASSSLPDNPLITLKIAELLQLSQKHSEAIALIEKLQNLTWSQTYYAQLPDHLSQLKTKSASALRIEDTSETDNKDLSK